MGNVARAQKQNDVPKNVPPTQISVPAEIDSVWRKAATIAYNAARKPEPVVIFDSDKSPAAEVHWNNLIPDAPDTIFLHPKYAQNFAPYAPSVLGHEAFHSIANKLKIDRDSVEYFCDLFAAFVGGKEQTLELLEKMDSVSNNPPLMDVLTEKRLPGVTSEGDTVTISFNDLPNLHDLNKGDNPAAIVWYTAYLLQQDNPDSTTLSLPQQEFMDRVKSNYSTVKPALDASSPHGSFSKRVKDLRYTAENDSQNIRR